MVTATHNYYDNMSVADIEKEGDRSRALTYMRAQYQRQQQAEGGADASNNTPTTNTLNRKVVSPAKRGIKNKQETNSQKKAYFKGLQNKYAKKRAKKKKIKILMRRYTKDIKRYEKTSWILINVAIAMSMLGGTLTWLYGLGYLLVIPATFYIDIKLWQAVNKKDRMKIRWKMAGAGAIKFIPIIGMIPASWLLVIYTKKIAKKRKKSAERKIKKLNMI